MKCIPVETANHEEDAVIVILHQENLARIAKADPVEIVLKDFPGNLVNPRIVICYEEDTPELMKLLENDSLLEILEYLVRGWEHRPDKGDAKPPQLVRTNRPKPS
jgi:hypothetical protein